MARRPFMRNWLLAVGISLILTDWYQSVPILPYTDERPLVTPTDNLIWESNELVAGDPIAAKNMTDFAMQAQEVAPTWLGAALIAQRAVTVVANDGKLRQVGMPRCYMIGYRWRF
jgi:hypothetical protein